jgi:hypothetical protein
VSSETRRRPLIEWRTRLLNHLACAPPQPCNAVRPAEYWLQPPVVDSTCVVAAGMAASEQLECKVGRGQPCKHPRISIAAHTAWWHLHGDIAGASGRLLIQSPEVYTVFLKTSVLELLGGISMGTLLFWSWAWSWSWSGR